MRQYEGLLHDKLAKVVTELQKQGDKIYLERRQAQGLSFKKGSSDCYIVYNGQHYEIEEKQPDGERTVMQEKWEAKCRRLGIPYILARTVEEVFDEIKKDK